MAQFIRQVVPNPVAGESPRPADHEKLVNIASPGAAAGKGTLALEHVAALANQVKKVSADLRHLDSKWDQQFSGFQETAYVTAEAVFEFDSELKKQRACLDRLTADIRQQTAGGPRATLLSATLEGVVQEFVAYRTASQKKFALLYAGLGTLALGLVAATGFFATKL